MIGYAVPLVGLAPYITDHCVLLRPWNGPYNPGRSWLDVGSLPLLQQRDSYFIVRVQESAERAIPIQRFSISQGCRHHSGCLQES